jgi:hypothetical protein
MRLLSDRLHTWYGMIINRWSACPVLVPIVDPLKGVSKFLKHFLLIGNLLSSPDVDLFRRPH